MYSSPPYCPSINSTAFDARCLACPHTFNLVSAALLNDAKNAEWVAQCRFSLSGSAPYKLSMTTARHTRIHCVRHFGLSMHVINRSSRSIMADVPRCRMSRLTNSSLDCKNCNIYNTIPEGLTCKPQLLFYSWGLLLHTCNRSKNEHKLKRKKKT